MFEEDEQKKEKKIDFDELSIEEIDGLIKDHKNEIDKLNQLLNKKKEKLQLAQDFFKKT
tara:strand:+ start:659 stop:835 length:177 start_codon:yes stop_codon:yes gene_type:complete